MPDRLWAPWRLQYIETDSGQEPACFFDELPNCPDDRQALIVHRGQTAFVLLNAFPYTNGHLMVAPYRHTADMSQLTDVELLEINQLVAAAMRWIGRAYRPHGYNVGINLGSAAGAGVPGHIHWHLVPRWGGDTNFMTTVGEVRVLPQNLEESWERLRAARDEDLSEGN